ncbi:winged helix DNA-binding domain-containing protein [Aliiroseovarius crassostreae]|uniref:winged helix-turn-helix domain-containing protein n=1 Tax=Aliiroseovarius crassostreae TaxID=154981 RepID=UPI00220B3EE4|nr:crosslink repair DNA glycosylase YcaQ family protein [Aliiroseovarius crassostreae]UWQ02345.1 winged helix DNA-binding domain-containing protein [Aliiroseovarius crassostreae]
MAPLTISNADLRRLWIWTNGLADTPTGPCDLMGIVDRLGFVQIDTIRNVTRAHNHILWSRNQNYREGRIWDHLSHRDLFEHFTHDASLIAGNVLPYWTRQFRRLGEHVARHDWYQSKLAQDQISAILKRIKEEGPLSTHAFDTKVASREMWARPPHKKALDQMWYGGTLATCYRRNFVKFYDLGTRVFPEVLPAAFPAQNPVEDAEAVDWLCRAAMDRLTIGTVGEIQRFWDAMSAREAKLWAETQRDLVPVDVVCADGTRRSVLAHPDIETRLQNAPAPTSRLRILNPFDPMIRDRKRTERIFGFEYRNEMFVPKAQRKWGYYVYPLLEGARFVGRIELKADRNQGTLSVIGFWPEQGMRWGAQRRGKLEAELARFARFAGLERVTWHLP